MSVGLVLIVQQVFDSDHVEYIMLSDLDESIAMSWKFRVVVFHRIAQRHQLEFVLGWGNHKNKH